MLPDPRSLNDKLTLLFELRQDSVSVVTSLRKRLRSQHCSYRFSFKVGNFANA